ncbi:MAG: MotA/TolQ/ExbB proton channel family protein [Spirochaetota bacterium]|nr:MotA/TolQ/ExbB proton channel family protein [Spirochaetota bacterium]
MDLSTIGGIVGGAILLAVSIIWAGGDLYAGFVDAASAMTTVGGMIAALFVAYPFSKLKEIVTIGKHAFRKKEQKAGEMINMLVTFSEKARREGLLALEDDIDEVNDPFLKKGVQLVVDGTDPELVKNIMITDLDKIEDRHARGRDIYDMASILAPAFGMIGTLMGLIIMLANLEDKASIGAGMALALITTLYGAILSNLIFIPLSKKLETLNGDELLLKEIMLEGTLSIQSGDNPRIVKDKLTSFLAPSIREEIAKQID